MHAVHVTACIVYMRMHMYQHSMHMCTRVHSMCMDTLCFMHSAVLVNN